MRDYLDIFYFCTQTIFYITMKPTYIISLVLLFCHLSGSAQRKMTSQEYIDTYKDLAIKSMIEYKIPASITLAQGLLESGNGGSELAVRSNNHFGIKCKSSWTGERVYHDDDSQGECFRKYSTVEHSYRDHSKFLTDSPRYASLFELSTTDYRGWAHGLKSAGYATNPRYAELLIDIIERNNLNEYDSNKPSGGKRGGIFAQTSQRSASFVIHPTERNNGVRIVTVSEGETFASIAAQYKMSRKRLLRINDLRDSQASISPGMSLYIEPKASRSRQTARHTITTGESYHSVSQQYGIKLKSLIKMNPLARTFPPKVGQELRLR